MNPLQGTGRAGRRGLPGLDLAPLAAALMVFVLLGVMSKVVPLASVDGVAQETTNGRSAALGAPGHAGSGGAGDKVIAVNRAGQIFFDGREVVPEELALELHHLAAGGAQAVRIAADSGVRFGAVTSVIDLCGEAGLSISDVAEVQ